MKTDLKTFVLRLLALNVIVLCILLTTGCNASWTAQAISIVAMLEPAILSALGIVTAFGVGVTPATLTAVQKWGAEAQTDLREVANLINSYNSADATEQPGILGRIQNILETITDNLNTILPDLHIADPVTQGRIFAVIGAIDSEIIALEKLVPILQGKTTTHAQLRVAVHAVKSADEFEKEFNVIAGSFGDQYRINRAKTLPKPGHDPRGDWHDEFHPKATAKPVEQGLAGESAFADAHSHAAFAAHEPAATGQAPKRPPKPVGPVVPGPR